MDRVPYLWWGYNLYQAAGLDQRPLTRREIVRFGMALVQWQDMERDGKRNHMKSPFWVNYNDLTATEPWEGWWNMLWHENTQYWRCWRYPRCPSNNLVKNKLGAFNTVSNSILRWDEGMMICNEKSVFTFKNPSQRIVLHEFWLRSALWYQDLSPHEYD